MHKRKDLSTIYISERVQEGLRPASFTPLTTVVAPMGYGKTTAVNWFLKEYAGEADVIRISIYSDNLLIFWKSVRDAFSYAGFSFLEDYPWPEDDAGSAILTDTLCHALASEKDCYIFLDDFHLLTEAKLSSYLCMLAGRLPENVHLIIAGRDRFIPAGEILRLGNKIHQVGKETLRLNHTELSLYARRLGTALTKEQIDSLLFSSEGWFSAIYLNLRIYAETNVFPEKNSDIYTMFTSAMIDPLPAEQREFLAMMGFADEFTLEMAQFVTGEPETEKLISLFIRQNSFVNQLPDGRRFRFHHMMKECAQRTFSTLSSEKQTLCLKRYGQWYENQRLFLHAFAFYRKCGDYASFLRVVQKDAGILISSLQPEEVLEDIGHCGKECLFEYPLAVLVLMRCMFNWRLIPRMLELGKLFLDAIASKPDMSPAEQGNLMGEYELIMSFLQYNDISTMSRLHRSAGSRMSRNAVSISNQGGWTFGSPSILMMFYRKPGELEQYLQDMDECMPHYCRITGGHGQGAEKIMRAEACLMQGRLSDARIILEKAYAEAEEAHQENMLLCCDHILQRWSLFSNTPTNISFEERYEELLRQRNIALINILNGVCAWYYAILGKVEKIPKLFSEHRLSSVNILAPGVPMYQVIENQVCLAQGEYVKVIGRYEVQAELAEAMHYGLVLIYLQLQNVAAYAGLGKQEEALSYLEMALNSAMPDKLILPFAENFPYLKEPLARLGAEGSYAVFVSQIRKLWENKTEAGREETDRPSAFACLTEREYEIVLLMRKRLSNREIAEELFLSEGSVKQYVNKIYGKLGISGDKRVKRRRLEEL